MSTTAAPPSGPAAAAIEQEPRGTLGLGAATALIVGSILGVGTRAFGLLTGKGVPTFGILSSTVLAPIFPRCMSCPVERLAGDAAVA